MKKRYLYDSIMSILMIVLMGYQITGNNVHEIIGVILLGMSFIHLFMQYKWFKNFNKIAKTAVT